MSSVCGCLARAWHGAGATLPSGSVQAPPLPPAPACAHSEPDPPRWARQQTLWESQGAGSMELGAFQKFPDCRFRDNSPLKVRQYFLFPTSHQTPFPLLWVFSIFCKGCTC